MSNSFDFRPIDKPLESTREWQLENSYWQSAWESLKKDRKASVSFIIIIGLFSFSLIGPLLWSEDPYRQDLNQISKAPSISSRALIVPFESWQRQAVNEQSMDINQKLSGVYAEGSPNTLSVKLVWRPDSRAGYYKIFRHEFEPRHSNDLGLPLGMTRDHYQNYFEDKLKLEAIRYFYSIAAYDQHNKIIAYETLALDVASAVSQGLVEKNLANSTWKVSDIDNSKNVIKLSAHPMGTDYLGRDMMARLMQGGKNSLLIGLLASFVFVLIGTLYGALAAFMGGKVDDLMMRFADFILALPFILFMILLKVSFGLGPGESGIGIMIFSLIVLSWPDSARLVRAQVLVLREQTFVLAAKINGASLFYILRRHLLPNVLSVVFVNLSFAIPSVILTEAFLSFIGLGVVAPTPSWGTMCQEGIKTFLFHPHELIFPALFIGLTVLAFNLLGDGLRDALDVKKGGS